MRITTHAWEVRRNSKMGTSLHLSAPAKSPRGPYRDFAEFSSGGA